MSLLKDIDTNNKNGKLPEILDFFCKKHHFIYFCIKQNISDSVLFIERTVSKGLTQARLSVPSLWEINTLPNGTNPYSFGIVMRVGEDD